MKNAIEKFQLEIQKDIIPHQTINHAKIKLITKYKLVIVCLANEFVFTVNETKKLVLIIQELTNIQFSKILILQEEFTSIDLEALKYLSSKDALKQATAIAVVNKSFAQNLMTRFFINVMKPIKPFKVFRNNMMEAINWLNEIEEGLKLPSG